MKRTLLLLAVLIGFFALAPQCHAAEPPAPPAQPALAATGSAPLPAAITGHCAAQLKSDSDLQTRFDKIFSPPTTEDTPCFKCFNLGLDCCSTPTGGTKCC
jgi:hypothetical protein